jgi:hypothetical protein
MELAHRMGMASLAGTPRLGPLAALILLLALINRFSLGKGQSEACCQIVDLETGLLAEFPWLGECACLSQAQVLYLSNSSINSLPDS